MGCQNGCHSYTVSSVLTATMSVLKEELLSNRYILISYWFGTKDVQPERIKLAYLW